jgi:GABA(A) receptor-associated protein
MSEPDMDPKSKAIAYKELKPLEDRKQEASKIKEKFPDRIPVILERSEKSLTIENIDKKKYLVPCDLSIGQFLFVVRKRLNMPQEQAIFLFVSGTIPPSSALVADIYEDHCDQDGFLYLQYSGENTFGSQSNFASKF